MRSRMLVISALAAAGVLGVAQWNAAAATNFNVTSSGMSAYVIGGVNNASLTLTKGETYTFTIVQAPFMTHPFWITTAPGSAEVSQNEFSAGVTNNGISSGVVSFTVPQSAPATLHYQCQFHDPMTGVLNIVAAAPAGPSLGGTALAMLAALLMLIATWFMKRRARA